MYTGSITYGVYPSKYMQFGYFMALDTHSQSVVPAILYLFIHSYRLSGIERYHV